MIDIDEVVAECEERGLSVEYQGGYLYINRYPFDLDDDGWTLYPLVGGALITCVDGTWDGASSADYIAQLIG